MKNRHFDVLAYGIAKIARMPLWVIWNVIRRFGSFVVIGHSEFYVTHVDPLVRATAKTRYNRWQGPGFNADDWSVGAVPERGDVATFSYYESRVSVVEPLETVQA